jgi:hypothetical protein
VATHLLIFASDAAIAAASYIVLSPINRGLALVAAFWRLADCAILSTGTLAQVLALKVLSAPAYLDAIGAAERQGLARLLLSARGEAMSVGFIFLGLGSAAFAWLWLRSRYVPRVFGAWGIFASCLLALGPLAILLEPRLGDVIDPYYMVPMLFYEVPLGLWLLVRGLKEPSVA